VPQFTRHAWVANEEIDADLLNQPGRLLYYNQLTADHPFTPTNADSAVFSTTLAIAGPRFILMGCSGPLDINDPAAHLSISFAVGAPTDVGTGNIGPAFTALGYRDAADNARTAENRSAWIHYITTVPGNYTFQLHGEDTGSGNHGPQLSNGFRFYILDVGAGV